MIQFTGYRYTENLRMDIDTHGIEFAIARVCDDAKRGEWAEWERVFWMNWVVFYS